MGGWELGYEVTQDKPVVLGCSCDTVGLFLPLKQISTDRVAQVNIKVFFFSPKLESKASLIRITKDKVWMGLDPSRGSGENMFDTLPASWMTASLGLWHSPCNSNQILRRVSNH